MARAAAAAVLALAVCCLLVAPAPARRPVDLPPRVPDAADRESAAEPLLPKPAADCTDEADHGTALAVPEEGTVVAVREEGPQRPSLWCLVFRCGSEPADAGSALVARGRSEEQVALDGSAWPAVAGMAEVEDDWEQQPYGSDSDSDSDSDDDDEGGIMGWLWSLTDRF